MHEHPKIAPHVARLKNVACAHGDFWGDKTIRRDVAVSVFLLISSIILTFAARAYANDYTGYIVPDILLDNLPVVNVSILFFQGALLFVFFVVCFVLYQPRFIPFTLAASALFFFVRAFFMVMTHLSPPSTEYYSYVTHEHHIREVLFTVSSGSDLFFSGHAGFPFLLALIFWKWKNARYIFLASSLLGGAIVILGHLHYTIDVFSAFFISFGVYALAKHFFKKEYQLLASASLS